MNRKFTFLVFLFLLVSGVATYVKADHMVGSDIYWKCDGGDTFTVTIVDYRDCNGIAFVNSPFVLTPVGSDCSGSAVTVNGTSSGGTDITPVCQRSCDRCPSNATCAFPYGIQQYFITATVVLPKGCCNYQISWEQCCRSAGITTGATWADYFITSQMSRCTFGYCDNSPYFTEPPVAIYCTNQCITYNPGASDVDRGPGGNPDSLSYAFTPPLTSASGTTPWTDAYSYVKPLHYDGFPNTGGVWNPPNVCKGFHLDSTTGDIEFKATKADVTVISLDVSEWRKDSLGVYRKIGEIRRDMQIIIIDCPANHPPIIPGINGGTSYSEKICADQQTCFDIKAFDLDQPDTVKVTWNDPGTMDGATFTVVPDGKKWPTAVFCWYPTDKDVRSYPYTFISIAKDNACPVPGFNSRAFSIYVIAAPSATYNADVGHCGRVCFQASPAATSATSITSYLWIGDGAPGYGPLYIIGRTGCYQYTRGGTYHYTLFVTGPNGCKRSYSDSVTIANFPGISLPNDTEVCNNSPTITIKSKLINPFQPYNVWWNLKDAKGDSLTSGTITEKITRDTAFRVNLSDGGCTNYDSMKIHVKQLPKPNIGPDQRGCWGHPIMLTTGLKHEPTVKWTRILPRDTVKNLFHTDTIQVLDSGMYVVSVQDSIGCPGTDTVNVYFNPPVVAKRIDSTVCVNATVTLQAGKGGSGASYTWINRMHNNVAGSSPTLTFTANGTSGGYGNGADFSVIIKNSGHGVTCADTGYYNIAVNTPTRSQLKTPPPKCITDPGFPLQTGPPLVDFGHQGGNWIYPRKPSAIVNNFLYPAIMGETFNNKALGYIHYIYTNVYKCVTDDSVRIIISNLPQVSAGPDTEICTANGRYLLSNPSVGPSGGSWSVVSGPKGALQYSKNLDSVFYNPNVAGVSSNGVYGVAYSYRGASSGGQTSCSNTDTVHIMVTSNPVIIMPPIDTLCVSTPEYPLNPNPQGGIWTIADATPSAALVHHGFDNSYGFLASAAGEGVHKLKYTAYGDRGKGLCPTVVYANVFVAFAPKKPDFYTSDKKWDYCVSQNAVSLVRTINDTITTKGEFQPTSYLTNTGNQYEFQPRFADTLDSTNNKLTFIVPYNKGCSVSMTHTIKVDGRPFVTIVSAPNVCQGPLSFEIQAVKSNGDLTWMGAGSFKLLKPDGTDVDYFPTATELYSGFQLSVTASNGGACPAHTATGVFIIQQPPTVKFSSNQVGCEPLAVRFNSDSSSVGGNYNPSVIKGHDWDFGDGSAHSQEANPFHVYRVTNGKDTQQFNVTLTETSDSGCVAGLVKSRWITVYATPRPVITANPQFTTIALPQVQFSFDPKSSGIDFNDPKTTYSWTFEDSSHTVSTAKAPQYTFGDTGKFTVRVAVNSHECTGDTFITVYVQPELIIYIPNVFKPDGKHGDGKTPAPEPNYYSTEVNNTFQPVISAYQSFQMTVYNRWGEQMYTTADPNKGWDGKYQGASAQEGVYVYVIKATGYLGKPYTFTGSVTMVR